MQLRNKSQREFTDISSEEYREYTTNLGTIRINSPLYLSISETGHYILDDEGISYYIPKLSWVCLRWKAKEDSPHFVK